MDYKEEQAQELEAIQSIYTDEFKVVSESPHCFEISVKGSNEDTRDEDKITLTADIRFTYVDTYPDEVPFIEINNPSDSLSAEKISSLLTYLQQEATENIGMVMVFTIVSVAQEKLLEFVQDIKKELEKKRQEEIEEQRILDEIKYKGTPVTLENFLAWKIKFDEEMKTLGKRKVTEKTKNKLTGKQLFERDVTLNESDIQFFSDSGGVKVDESLFQDLDDLELEGDLDD